MLDRTKIFLTIAAFAWATPVAAQAPAPTTTAFDGTYVGVSRASEGNIYANATNRACRRDGQPSPLTIAGGVARWGSAEGSVDAQGLLVLHTPYGERFEGQMDGRGTVTGRYTGTCNYHLVWQKEGK